MPPPFHGDLIRRSACAAQSGRPVRRHQFLPLRQRLVDRRERAPTHLLPAAWTRLIVLAVRPNDFAAR